MGTRDSNWPQGTPCWVDLGIPDIDRARIFYSAVFGWVIPEGSPETGGYTVATLKGSDAAGIGPKMSPAEVPPTWMTYIASDNVDVTADRIKSAGGQLVMEPMDVMTFGRMAVAVDTTGATFGLWQGNSNIGAAIFNEPGALAWNEQMSRDFEAAKAFYADVFGYTYNDLSADGFKYATFKVDDRDVGGMGEYPADVPGSVPAAWSTYFGTADTDASVAKIIGQGGSTIREPADSPYGRLATVLDDQGAVFSLISL
jgi:predicted enzyme related to lactoylglutathione lyase